MSTRKAPISTGLFRTTYYDCVFPWPADCGIQGGEDGLVLQEGSLEEVLTSPQKSADVILGAISEHKPALKSYKTAFFEATPTFGELSTFIRGEGKSVTEAEAACWKHFERMRDCKGHDFDRRNRRDGYAYCKHCGFSDTVFEPLEHCKVCGIATYFTHDVDNNYYCKNHEDSIPEEKVTESAKYFRKWRTKECLSCHSKFFGRETCPYCIRTCQCGQPGVKIRFATSQPMCEKCMQETNATPAAFSDFESWRASNLVE